VPALGNWDFLFGILLILGDQWGVGKGCDVTGGDSDSAGPGGVRVDVWLWAVRLYRTRSLAAEACRLGRVTRGAGEVIKPSRLVRVGDELWRREEFLCRRLRVDGLVERRVGAKLVAGLVTDVTPLEEVVRARELGVERRLSAPVFAAGAGRPTKAQRRALEAWHRAERGGADDDEAGEPGGG